MRTRQRHHKRISPVAAVAPLSILLAIASVSPASAYRPFDGTDAAVADPGELEIELQPGGALWQQAQKTLVAPATVFNFGLSQGWEAVLEGRMETPLSPAGPTSLSASAVSLKYVVIPGSLQGKEGPSVATEFGILLPDSNSQTGVGASVAGIVSQRWDWGTINLNAATALTRDRRGDLFLSAIIEGPAKWTVRPVAEIFYENEFGQAETISALVGLIWQVRDNLSFDVGIRQALSNGHPVSELRAGLTIGFPELFISLGPNYRSRRESTKQ
jgi:hypothetical protein